MGDRDLLIFGHNVHLAHGRAVKVLREKVQNANIGITLATQPKVPFDSTEEQAYNSYFWCGLPGFFWSNAYWMDPIATGKYPEQLIKDAKEAGVLDNDFSEEDMKIISEKIDFLGINIYEAQYEGNYQRIRGTAHTELQWDIYPDALKWGVIHNYKRYNLPIYITENGISTHDWVSLDGKVHDPNRIDFLARYLHGLKEGIQAGADVRGYFQWSFMDNFEWARGYNPRFGMIFVDYKTLDRTPKDSAYWYKKVIETNGKDL